MGRSVRRTSSVTTPIASSSTAAGSTKDVQLRPAQGCLESLSRPCVRLRLPVWRRLIKMRLLAARSNGRGNKAETLSRARLFIDVRVWPQDGHRRRVEPRPLSGGEADLLVARARAVG